MMTSLRLLLCSLAATQITVGHDIRAEYEIRSKRSIDLSASHSLIPGARLTTDIVPRSYALHLRPNIEESSFTGNITIILSWNKDTKNIFLNAHQELELDEGSIQIRKIISRPTTDTNRTLEDVTIRRVDRLPRTSVFGIYLKETIKQGTECELTIRFSGQIWENSEGLFKGTYTTQGAEEEKQYLATYMRPHNARRLFPCFDEPEFKVPYTVTISRPRNYVTLFNTPLVKTVSSESNVSDYVVDYFATTPSMSSFTFGFVTSQLQRVEIPTLEDRTVPEINIWADNIAHSELKNVHKKLCSVYKHLTNYFNVTLPLTKIDVLAIPELSSLRPADNWGMLMFKESELLKRGYYGLAQELVYQWLGAWVTPSWWSDAHINKALASFLAAGIVIEIDNGVEFNGKYPMTLMYSLYYEFSKRYPHSRLTGMKQETTSFKTELVMRMLNYTLGGETFREGIRQFISERHFGTFFGDDLWNALTKQAITDKMLNAKYSISHIAGSWITKDRLPVITVRRDYEARTARVEQKVYLRERPHDVPEQDKMLWWIPIVMVVQTKLDFTNTTAYTWMERTREITLTDLPDRHQFIIINPEEIGPFPVNYDETNWNLLSTFLQTESGRTSIPVYTRAKLLHDAWNLAYAGNLSFATAFNMTLFMRYERHHIVWNPVFTFIDHIGRHIDMSTVHTKFERYVRVLLTPLYEELAGEVKGEESWRTDLRSLSKTFLCRAGYRPCIEVAQAAFGLWMESQNPDEANPVPNQYICPVFKWGTMQEWEFGLERVINFPKTRMQSERTHLLKTLVGCPVQAAKIKYLLNIIIIEGNGNFTENDILLVFNMLTGSASGYMTLFNFLTHNWDIINEEFKDRRNLWNSLISSATGVFTTNEGYEMVKQLHEQRRGEFGTAEFIIQKSLKNIKEEAKWSDENLPIIEQWLDQFLETVSKDENKFIERK